LLPDGIYDSLILKRRDTVPKENNADRDRLGKAVKAARKSKGLTQSQLAGLLEISPRHLKGIENSGRTPSLKLFRRIVRELDISTEDIFNQDKPSSGLRIMKGGGNTG
jgi:DNA-binding XRE family transcriptional regulator